MTSPLTTRKPASFARKRGTGPGRNGSLSPDSGASYVRESNQTPWTPTLEEIALLHRYLEPNPRVSSSKFTGMRTFADRKYRVGRSFSLISVAHWEGDWKVLYYATGSPRGWDYRLFSTSGDAAGFAQTITEIRTTCERSATFPEQMRLPRGTRQRLKGAKEWCANNCEPEAWLYFEGKFRFRDASAATMFKIVWG